MNQVTYGVTRVGGSSDAGQVRGNVFDTTYTNANTWRQIINATQVFEYRWDIATTNNFRRFVTGYYLPIEAT